LNIKTHKDCNDYKLSADKKPNNEMPQYNKKLEMDIVFPKQSIVRIMICNDKDYEIGSTYIDLEYRMYHSK